MAKTVWVDDTEEIELIQFTYKDQWGDKESVDFYPGSDCVEIVGSSEDKVTIFNHDIPKLIKALEAAYKEANK